MEQPEGPPEPSRRQPPRAPTPDAIPIPEAATARPRPRPSGVQDVLAAHQRAVDARIEEGLREIRLAVADAVGRPPEPETIQQPAVEPPPTEDVVRGLLAHTEERFQALSLRLRRIEDVLRSVGKREGPEVDHHLEALRRSITSIAATQQQEFARLVQFQRALAQRVGTTQRAVAEALAKQQRRAAEALAKQQGDAIADLGTRIGRGVAAIARRMQDDLQVRQDALLERYLRSLAAELRRHRERRARPAPPAASPRPPAEAPAVRPTTPPAGTGAPQRNEPEPIPPPRPSPPRPSPDRVAPEAERTEARAGDAIDADDAGDARPRQEPRHYLIERRRHPGGEVEPPEPPGPSV